MRGITVLSRGVPMLALRNGTELMRFHSSTPSTLRGTAQITGLQAGETMVGIDVRPANGQVYGVGWTSRLYRINAVTGAAMAVGPPFSRRWPAPGSASTSTGADRLRMVSDDEQNLSVDLDTRRGERAGAVDGRGGISGAAYSGNVDGTQFSTLYASIP